MFRSKKFLKLLVNNESSIDLDTPNKYVSKHIPDTLFRYRSFNEYWREGLFQGWVHLTNPKNYNDPFDGLYHIDHHSLYKATKFRLSKNIFSKIKDLFEYNYFIDKKPSGNRYHEERVKTACFSKTNASVLMWSHYADSHKGFCVEYTSDLSLFYPYVYLFPMIYSKKKCDLTKIQISLFKNHARDNAVLRKFFNYSPFFIKSLDWSYENEWRIISNTPDIQKVCLKQNIKAVYLGLRARETYPEYISEILENMKNEDIPVYQMETSKKGYNLIAKRIHYKS